jgi:hypothetical protein
MNIWRTIIIIWVAVSTANAQSFEVDQIEQLFRPRLKVDSKYIFDSSFLDTSGRFSNKEAAIAFTFPIKIRLDADFKLDISKPNLKDIVKNSVRLRASQTLGFVRMNGRQTQLGYDTVPQKNTGGLTLGLLGLKLTKKYRVMFWSAGLNISEQDKTINSLVPRGTALLGQLHLRGIRKNYFYGVMLSYSDAYLIPIPFFGGSQPIGDKWIFNYTLPAQLNVQYRNDRKLMITAGVNVDGFRTGMIFNNGRANLNYASAMAFGNVRYKFSRTLVGRIEGGYILYQKVRFTNTDYPITTFTPNTGPYVQAGFSVLFGKSIWEKIADAIPFGASNK